MKYLFNLFVISLAAMVPANSGDIHEKSFAEIKPGNISGEQGKDYDDLSPQNNDSTYLSPLFYEEMERTFKDYEVTSGTVYTKNHGNVIFPKILPFNESVMYSCQNDKITHELEVRRINLADVVYSYSSKRNDSILVFNSDTVTFCPGRVLIETKYEYGCSGVKYQNHSSKITRILKFGDAGCNYANFSYRDYNYYGPNPMNKIPLLKKAGSKEPYRDYLQAMLQKMSEYQYEHIIEGKTGSKQKFDKAYDKFKLLLEEIRIDGLTAELLQDMTAMDIAIYYEMDSVIRDLRGLGFNERERAAWDKVQDVKFEDFPNLRGRIFTTISGDVTSNRFETLYFSNSFNERDGSYQYLRGFPEYHPVGRISLFTPFQDFEIVLIPDYGFEGSSHIITVWQKEGEKYNLKYILDKLLYSSIGYVHLDTIFEIDENRNLLIGTTFGGDAGDIWGSVWVGVWELPRSLKIVFEKYWVNSIDEHTGLAYSLKNNKAMVVTRKNYVEEWRQNEYVRLDSTIVRETILFDTLITKDHIKFPH